MSQEIIEAVREIERDKGIEEGALVAALEDALLAAYKKTPGASRHATVEMDDDTGDFRVFSVELPADIEERLLDEARERKLEELEQLEEETGERQHTLISDDDLDIDWSDVPTERRQARGRHARGLRPHRRADREAGHPAADPRGGAADDVRRVHRPRHRGRDGHRPAGRRPQQRPRRPRQGRGAAAALRAGRRRALRAGLADQGRHHRGALRDEGPAGHPLAARSRADQDAVRARGAGDRGRPRRDPRRRPRAGLPLEDRGRVARPGRRPGRRLRRPARLARAHGRLRAPRREDRHHPVEPGAGAVRREGALARRASARSTSTTRRARRPSSSPTTSSRSRSARRA